MAAPEAPGVGPPAQDESIIREGSRIILDVNGDRHVFVVVKGRNKVKLGQAFCSIQPLIGCPYGSTFGVAPDGKTLQQIPPAVAADWLEEAALEVTKNNSQLIDAGDANQQLTSERIADLRSQGVHGSAIVEALAAHSATFDAKTEFSQAKYRKKKAKKYVITAVARRATAAAIAEAYFLRQPARIGHLRLDALALLLSLAGLSAHARPLVLDACGGLVLGAAAERLAGFGTVTGVYMGGAPPSREALAQFDAGRVQSGVRHASLASLLRRRPFNACIVAAPGLDPGAALRALLPLLAPSTPFAVYSPWMQPLAEAMHALRAEHAAVGLALQESWWREQQVLPSRTHPKMQMNHGGGFVLSGTTVAPPTRSAGATLA
ncbi:tRNA (adenine(58)-N(1))-methyltransferase non-catalytic subunit TRM6 [Auxenochlorella protothecoides]|uniref:tRNA (adenine(58)-N(1))-methyltransferase non-catalytic subunit TRM6 n=1 Tax=Auxenochlorella protothecoides TaxID=3075 RepID=A0A087SAL1_AUXPR|nr:tRNA (adenine(58)-N(1))-methyltransferase non-catalytic subunit TRM6 [Auxenochlorella protothecoides]KFM22765.1 tRNA (adenine(58)-N(1))-methyltransferase non-catalytic subunit TRM6 [Auxenochlorella protothecoides]